jgi:hypothetical protein
MATEKWVARLEAKLDALLANANIDMAQFDDTETKQPTRAARELTAQEQDAINNAPKTPAAEPDTPRGPRVTAQNAPDTSTSVPTVPSDAVGTVTVETKETDGDVSVDTMPASDAKRGRK